MPDLEVVNMDIDPEFENEVKKIEMELGLEEKLKLRKELQAQFEIEENKRMEEILIKREEDKRILEEKAKQKEMIDNMIRVNNEEIAKANRVEILRLTKMIDDNYEDRMELRVTAESVSEITELTYLELARLFNREETEELSKQTLSDAFCLVVNFASRRFIEYIYAEEKYIYLLSVKYITLSKSIRKLPEPYSRCFTSGSIEYKNNYYTSYIVDLTEIAKYTIEKYVIANFMPQGEWFVVFPSILITPSLGGIKSLKATSAYFIFHFIYNQEFGSRNNMYFIHSSYIFNEAIRALEQYENRNDTDMFKSFAGVLKFEIMYDMNILYREFIEIKDKPYQINNFLILVILKYGLELKYQARDKVVKVK